MQSSTIDTDRCRGLAAQLVAYFESGTAPDGLFAPDVFLDMSLPLWRLQADGAEAATAMRAAGHPWPGRVPSSRFDRTETGFVLEVEETWDADGDTWYCRELFRADVTDGAISQLTVYCTGDWDSARVAEHRATVTLIRP
jgi:hypothetical protein